MRSLFAFFMGVLALFALNESMGQSKNLEPIEHSISGSIGGLSDFKDGSFLFSQIDYSIKKRLSLNFTLHRDDTNERWSDGSKGYYSVYSPSFGARLATKENGRGFFAQVGIGYAFAFLRVTESNGLIKNDNASSANANWKLGYRWSKKTKGLFLEAILNYSTSWNDLILQTDPTPVNAPAKRPTIDWHSWNNYKGDIGQTFLLGIGYTF